MTTTRRAVVATAPLPAKSALGRPEASKSVFGLTRRGVSTRLLSNLALLSSGGALKLLELSRLRFSEADELAARDRSNSVSTEVVRSLMRSANRFSFQVASGIFPLLPLVHSL